MVATARKFKHLVTGGGPSDSESEDDITVFEVEGQFSTKTNEPLREFAGCGAHRLNNSIWDSVDGMKFFKQLNDFSLKQRTKISEHSLVWPSCTIGICLKTHGKAERGQIFFKQLQFFASWPTCCEANVSSDDQNSRNKKEPRVGGTFPDNVIPAIRRMESFLQKVSQEEQIQHEFRNFCCRLLVSTKKVADLTSLLMCFVPQQGWIRASNKERYLLKTRCLEGEKNCDQSVD